MNEYNNDYESVEAYMFANGLIDINEKECLLAGSVISLKPVFNENMDFEGVLPRHPC